jgi:SpoU rRNA methylase family enzyme
MSDNNDDNIPASHIANKPAVVVDDIDDAVNCLEEVSADVEYASEKIAEQDFSETHDIIDGVLDDLQAVKTWLQDQPKQ